MADSKLSSGAHRYYLLIGYSDGGYLMTTKLTDTNAFICWCYPVLKCSQYTTSWYRVKSTLSNSLHTRTLTLQCRLARKVNWEVAMTVHIATCLWLLLSAAHIIHSYNIKQLQNLAENNYVHAPSLFRLAPQRAPVSAITKPWSGWDGSGTEVVGYCCLIMVMLHNAMAVPHIFQMAAFHVSCRQPRSWLLWHKWGPRWRKQILKWPVHHDSHANVKTQTSLRENKTYMYYVVVTKLNVVYNTLQC